MDDNGLKVIMAISWRADGDKMKTPLCISGRASSSPVRSTSPISAKSERPSISNLIYEGDSKVQFLRTCWLFREAKIDRLVVFGSL